MKRGKRPCSQKRSDKGGGSGTHVKKTPESRVARDGRPHGQVQVTRPLSPDFKAQSCKATLKKGCDEASEDAAAVIVAAANLSAAMARALDELDRGIAVDTEVANKYVGEAEDEYRVSQGGGCATPFTLPTFSQLVHCRCARGFLMPSHRKSQVLQVLATRVSKTLQRRIWPTLVTRSIAMTLAAKEQLVTQSPLLQCRRRWRLKSKFSIL